MILVIIINHIKKNNNNTKIKIIPFRNFGTEEQCKLKLSIHMKLRKSICYWLLCVYMLFIIVGKCMRNCFVFFSFSVINDEDNYTFEYFANSSTSLYRDF